ncbi:glycosyltransferase family 1 protein [Patellaria atrata CBS 101060]|uniref:Glycosyltransferase family 1 protein n=1 Tax=Patellaria atrata CBS 101060 TaxID=1346257 RepID=A0A9P4S2I8_9PEZI|nr:glycosyltransferase family 1 protein [Patellaria atrata CBS 101060]
MSSCQFYPVPLRSSGSPFISRTILLTRFLSQPRTRSSRNMKFLVSSLPLVGNIRPLQYIVRRLIENKHEVVWLMDEEFKEYVQASGAQIILTARLAEYNRVARHKTSGTREEEFDILKGRVAAQIDDYRRVLATFKADAVIISDYALGAQAIYDLGGLPYITVGVGPIYVMEKSHPVPGSGRLPPKHPNSSVSQAYHQMLGQDFSVYKPVAAIINEQRHRFRLKPVEFKNIIDCLYRSPFLHLHMSASTFEFPLPRTYSNIHFIGATPPTTSQGYEIPDWWSSILPGSIVVHISHGTIPVRANLIRDIRALSELEGVNFIITCPAVDGAFPDKSILPPNVYVEKIIPYRVLMPHLQVVVTRGGFGTVTSALTYGVPLVVCAERGERDDIGARVSAHRAGISMASATPGASSIRRAVQKVLKEDKYKNAAMAIAVEMNKGNRGVERGVQLIEQLVQFKKTVAAADSMLHEHGTTMM